MTTTIYNINSDFRAILGVVIVLTVIGTGYEISSERGGRNRGRDRDCDGRGRYEKHVVAVIGNNNEGDVKIISSSKENSTTIELKLDSAHYHCSGSGSGLSSSGESSTTSYHHRCEMTGKDRTLFRSHRRILPQVFGNIWGAEKFGTQESEEQIVAKCSFKPYDWQLWYKLLEDCIL